VQGRSDLCVRSTELREAARKVMCFRCAPSGKGRVVQGTSDFGLPYTRHALERCRVGRSRATLHPAYPRPLDRRRCVQYIFCRVRLPLLRRAREFGAALVHPCAWRCGFGGRESIFLFSHTNEFCGKSKVAPEPRVAGSGRRWGRWTHEEGGARGAGTTEQGNLSTFNSAIDRAPACPGQLN
jgi:hypothetical protein